MRTILMFLALALTPAAVLVTAVLVTFAYVGAGTDWSFVAFVALIGTFAGTCGAIAEHYETKPYPARTYTRR